MVLVEQSVFLFVVFFFVYTMLPQVYVVFNFVSVKLKGNRVTGKAYETVLS